MGKKQIEWDFDRLYAGGNRKILVENYYKKKKKDMLLLFLGGIIILGLLLAKVVQDGALETGNTIKRNSYGEGLKEVNLEVKKGEGDWQAIAVELREKEYTKEEVEEYFDRLEKELPELILGKNTSIDQIEQDLNLPREVEGYPFYLTWKSSNDKLLDSGGTVHMDRLKEGGELVSLSVTMEYQEWKREHSFFVRIADIPLSETELFLKQLSDKVKKEEEESRLEEEVNLPLYESGEELSWRYPLNKGIFLLILFFPFLLVILWREKDKEVHDQVKEREDCLISRYPEFVSKLILFMEAGMTAKGAIYRIVQTKQIGSERGKEREYLYEELQYICRRMNNGMGEKDAYELLGKRCELPIYRKLSTLLIQNIQKGSYGMLETLRQESWQTNEDRKNRIKRKGEEAGTKLLFPMMLMLGMVMILIIVPACFSFQM
ncbi:MAG: type II secretion system F family protein [Lachnospiraceae bacterium]|nr:type II secretion system F family protein [Lachnospiraceae bacterium]